MQMIAKQLCGAVHQRHGAHLAALALEADLGGRIEADIAGAEVDQLLYACTGIVEDAQQYRVPSPGTGPQIRLCKDRSQLRFAEITDRWVSMSPQWNGQDLLALQQPIGHL